MQPHVLQALTLHISVLLSIVSCKDDLAQAALQQIGALEHLVGQLQQLPPHQQHTHIVFLG